MAGASQAYLALDRVHGEVRLVDAVKGLIGGEYGGYDPGKQMIILIADNRVDALAIAPDVVILLNSARAGLNDLAPGDRIQIAINSDGTVTYLQAER